MFNGAQTGSTAFSFANSTHLAKVAVENFQNGQILKTYGYNTNGVVATYTAMARTNDTTSYLFGNNEMFVINEAEPELIVKYTINLTPASNIVGTFVAKSSTTIYLVSRTDRAIYYFNYSEVFLNNAITLKSIALPSESPMTVAFDDTNGLAFIGNAQGYYDILNVQSNTMYTTYKNPTQNNPNRQVTIVDSVNKVIYSCSGNHEIFFDVLSYKNISTSLTLESVGHKLFSSSPVCQVGAYDAAQGQVFFAGYYNTKLHVTGINIYGTNENTYDFAGEFKSVPLAAMAVAESSTLLIGTTNSTITVSYTSACTNQCGVGGKCVAGKCVCQEPISQSCCAASDDCTPSPTPGTPTPTTPTPSPTPANECNKIVSFANCTLVTGCGWCQSGDAKCAKGDVNGPFDFTCTRWYPAANSTDSLSAATTLSSSPLSSFTLLLLLIITLISSMMI
eukprot:gene9099-10670_t